MSLPSRAAFAAILSLALAGCANVPLSQPLHSSVRDKIQTVETKVGISQVELYAAYAPSMAGASAAASCGAIPGLGILLAAACGGAMGAVDASVNASRAKAAEEAVRPLKDAIVELQFDQLMQNSLSNSLRSVAGPQFASIAVTKTVNEKEYEQIFRASSAHSVMFVNVDYHLTPDFSMLEVSIRSLLFPRAPEVRSTAGQIADLATVPTNKPLLAAENAVYRNNVTYQSKLPVASTDIAQNVDAWNQNGAYLLRTALLGGITEVTRALATDIQRGTASGATPVRTIEIARGVKADLVSESASGQLLRYADGTLWFKATAPSAASTFVAAPAVATPVVTAPAVAIPAAAATAIPAPVIPAPAVAGSAIPRPAIAAPAANAAVTASP